MMQSDQPAPVTDSIDVERMSVYLRKRIELSGDIEVLQFPAGHSNLTYLLRWGGRELVLKRAPPGAKAKSAHDMGREFRMLSKLHGQYPFAPRAYDYCGDESIIGSPFCVIERIEGAIVRREYEEATQAATIQRQFAGLLDALCELHDLDPGSVGLGDFGRPKGYTLRQVEGWQGRFAVAKTDDTADFDEVLAWMTARIPPETGPACVIHNDFKLDNLVWDATDVTRLKGVLDWEMSTVGDPLLDLACTLSFWAEPGDPSEFRALRNMPSAGSGVLSRGEVIEYYSRRTGRSAGDINFYLCFGFFRRAVIEQQKYARYLRGDTTDQRFSQLDRGVRVLRDMCQGLMT